MPYWLKVGIFATTILAYMRYQYVTYPMKYYWHSVITSAVLLLGIGLHAYVYDQRFKHSIKRLFIRKLSISPKPLDVKAMIPKSEANYLNLLPQDLIHHYLRPMIRPHYHQGTLDLTTFTKPIEIAQGIDGSNICEYLTFDQDANIYCMNSTRVSPTTISPTTISSTTIGQILKYDQKTQRWSQLLVMNNHMNCRSYAFDTHGRWLTRIINPDKLSESQIMIFNEDGEDLPELKPLPVNVYRLTADNTLIVDRNVISFIDPISLAFKEQAVYTLDNIVLSGASRIAIVGDYIFVTDIGRGPNFYTIVYTQDLIEVNAILQPCQTTIMNCGRQHLIASNITADQNYIVTVTGMNIDYINGTPLLSGMKNSSVQVGPDGHVYMIKSGRIIKYI